MTERLRQAGLVIVFIACIGAWVVPQVSIDYRRARWAEPDVLLFLPTGQYLRAASLGYESVLADALYLWSIQYYGHHRTPEGRRYLWHIFNVITDLDPQYEDVYLTGALIMAHDMGDAESAIRLLDKGAASNPGEWIYPTEAGHYAWMRLDDHRRAREYFERALAIPGVPPIVERIRAGMAEFSGDNQAAFELWLGIWEAARAQEDAKVESIAWQHVFDLKVEIDIETLSAAIREFRQARGRPPRVLEALVGQGFLSNVPVSPAGDEYEYDPLSGRVVDPRGGSRAGR